MGLIIREIEVKGVLTKSNLPVADYSVNPYVGCAHGCKYCYASFMKRFTNHPEPWGGFVDVKHWPPIQNPGRYAGKELFIGSVTDPYQPAEAEYGRTRALLEQMRGSGCAVSIATKSDLVLRDLDLIRTFPNARVSWSITRKPSLMFSVMAVNSSCRRFKSRICRWICLCWLRSLDSRGVSSS